MESHREIADQAADFLLKRGGGDWSPREQAHLDAWLDASFAHRVAFLRLEAVWDDKAGALRTLGHGYRAGSIPPTGEWRNNPFFRAPNRASNSPKQVFSARAQVLGSASESSARRRRWIAAAASLVVAVCAASYFQLRRGGDSYSTPIGGVASVPLRDGSHITLNTASQVRVVLSSTERRIDLDQGEVFFEVAKDPRHRPFVVTAGNKRVIAVGTKFSVSREGEEVHVIVTEGTVRLESASAPMRVESAGGSAEPSRDVQSVPLVAGTVAHTREQDLLVQSKPLPQAEEDLSWREGFLTFHETPLAEVISQFNRYNAHRIIISDPAVAAIHISGAFRPTNADALLRLLEDNYSLRATAGEDVTTLTRN